MTHDPIKPAPLTPDPQRGLYRKFNVTRTDGSSEPGRKHHGCEYFVLDLTHDKHAGPALAAYARSCEPEFPALASDLMARVALPVAAGEAEDDSAIEILDITCRRQEAELAAVRAELEQVKAQNDAIVTLKELHMSGNAFEMTLEPAKEIMCHIVDACRLMCEKATNYVECSVKSGPEQYYLTIRKPMGKTDHQMRMQAEAERDRAVREVAVAKGLLKEANSAVVWVAIQTGNKQLSKSIDAFLAGGAGGEMKG